MWQQMCIKYNCLPLTAVWTLWVASEWSVISCECQWSYPPTNTALVMTTFIALCCDCSQCVWQIVRLFCLLGGQLIDVIRARQGPLPCNEVLQAFYQTCSAVHHMHRQKPPIIHRDLKVSLLWPFSYWLTHYTCLSVNEIGGLVM